MSTWPEVEAALAAHSEQFRTDHTCPSSAVLGLLAVHDSASAHLLCPSCGVCWVHTEHGALHVADPLGCSGCRDQPKQDCLVHLSATFPRFGLDGQSEG